MRVLRVSLIVAACLALVVCQFSTAQVVPFNATGSVGNYSPETGEFTTAGNATHMGAVTGSGVAFTTADLGNGLFIWVCPFHEITAADGSQIFLSGGGLVQFIPLGGSDFTAEWSGEFNVDGGNGRFAKIKPGNAPLDVTASNDPFVFPPAPGDIWTFSWTLDGTIDLGRRRK